MKIVTVRAMAREGYSGFWSAGRLWPSATARTVELVDQDDDPKPDPALDSPAHLNQRQIGRKTLACLEAEGFLTTRIEEVADADGRSKVMEAAVEAKTVNVAQTPPPPVAQGTGAPKAPQARR